MKQNAALALSNLLLFRGNKQENFHFCCSSFLCIDSYFHLDLLSSAWRTSFHISCSASFLMVNPFSFYTSEKFFISTFFLKAIFIRYRILSWWFFFFSPWKMLTNIFLLTLFLMRNPLPSIYFLIVYAIFLLWLLLRLFLKTLVFKGLIWCALCSFHQVSCV